MAAPRPSMDTKPTNLSEPALRKLDFANGDRHSAKSPRPSGDARDAEDTEDTASISSDEFDWSEEEEEVEDKDPKRLGKTKARRGRAVWLAFMKLARPLRVFLVLLLGSGLLIAPLLVFQFRFKDNVAYPHVFPWSLWLSITFAAACVTSTLVDVLPVMFIRVVDLFGGRVENLKTQIELTMAVKAWIKLALDITWMWVALSVIRASYKPPGSYWAVVNRVMQALFSAGLILLAEKIFLRYVAINYHQTALADRLAENRLGLKALDRLSNAQPVAPKKPAYAAGTARGHKTNRSSLGLGFLAGGTRSGEASSNASPVNEKAKDGLPNAKDNSKRARQEKKQENSERRKKALASIVVDQIGNAIGEVALKNSQFHKQNDYNNLYSARKLAQKLFEALSDVMPPRSHLIVDDFVPYFNSDAEARAAFALFDKDGNGDITKKEMREAVQRIYRERKSLVASLKDVSSAVGKLDAVLLSVAALIVLFICLLIFNPKDTLTSLVPLATIVLGFSFIFGHSAQLLFESMIFTFSTHTFDIGDLVQIDDMILFVKEFGLFCVTFRRVDGMEVIVPTSLLASSKLIHNLRRSGSMWETTNLMVAYDTPLSQIETVRQRMKTYVLNNNREWSNVDLHIDKMPYQNEIHLIVAMEHRPNWQDWGGRWARRTKFMRHMKEVLEELDIRYTKPVQPVIMPPQYSRDGIGRGMGFESRESLGNAGYYAGSPEMSRSPVRAMRPGPEIRIG